MKKILLLGGSAQQVVAIETAKRLGYYTVLCDYFTDNPGQYVADKFHLTSTTDKEAILNVAQEERIDGVLAYASDPAAPTAAYVADMLNLPGNPYDSVEILCNKDRFRKFLKDSGFCAPVAEGYAEAETALGDVKNGKFHLPVIIKPVDSSGSKGASVIRDWNDIKEALDFAFSFSRSHRIIVEEFIERKHPYLIGGDIFVLNDTVVMWGLMNCHRDPKVNPLVPVGKSYPPELSAHDLEAVKDTLRKMVKYLNFHNGSMNVELIVDKNDRVFPIDIGPRAGGNMIPDLCGYIFDADVVEMAVKAAIGENISYRESSGKPCYATYNLHSAEHGNFERVEFLPEIEKFIIKKCIYKKAGDKVEFFDNASKCIGIIFMKFPDEDTMRDILRKIDKYVKVEVG